MTTAELKPRQSAKRTLASFGVGSGILLTVQGLLVGRSALEKTLTALAMPCGLIWYLLSFAVFLAVVSRQKLLAFVTIFTWLLYTALGNGYVSCWLAQNIEAPFITISPLDEDPFDCVVVLGGGASMAVNLRHQGNSSGDRIILAAQLYHTGKAAALICTGVRIEALSNVNADPAETSRDVLIGLGVPVEDIEMVGGRTTAEEMKTLGERFSGTDLRVGLITSAWHLRRAMRLANKNGFHPEPLPADFMAGPDVPWTLAGKINSCIPQADCFTWNTRIAREYLGSFVGR